MRCIAVTGSFQMTTSEWIDKAVLFKEPDQIAAEVLQPDNAVL